MRKSTFAPEGFNDLCPERIKLGSSLVERGLQRFDLVAVQLGNKVCQMIQFVQVFILGEIVV